jgi:hypothetical protein
MSDRPTQDELDDIDHFAETGKTGCLIPDDEVTEGAQTDEVSE